MYNFCYFLQCYTQTLRANTVPNEDDGNDESIRGTSRPPTAAGLSFTRLGLGGPRRRRRNQGLSSTDGRGEEEEGEMTSFGEVFPWVGFGIMLGVGAGLGAGRLAIGLIGIVLLSLVVGPYLNRRRLLQEQESEKVRREGRPHQIRQTALVDSVRRRDGRKR